jgi:hypothetical protein
MNVWQIIGFVGALLVLGALVANLVWRHWNEPTERQLCPMKSPGHQRAEMRLAMLRRRMKDRKRMQTIYKLKK